MRHLGVKLPMSSHAYRTEAFDADMLDALQAGARQVVVLGAGFDSRGYWLPVQLRGIRFIEVDHGPTQEYKKERVRQVLGALPESVS